MRIETDETHRRGMSNERGVVFLYFILSLFGYPLFTKTKINLVQSVDDTCIMVGVL